MVQIPIIQGIYASENAQFRQSFPINLEPVVLETGLAKGYLRTAPGISPLGTGPGDDRGGFNWNGMLLRVMGTKLVSVAENGSVEILGDVGGGGRCAFALSFDRLAINSGDRLYYWDGSALAQVTDPDLGPVIDVVWVDGRFMTTDGTSLVVTDLNDPMAIDPLKYGSSEVDPDPVLGLIWVRGEIYAINRYTIENFRNVAGAGFPFQRNQGAMIPRGAVGTHAKAPFIETFAFVGSGRNEAPSVYIGGGGQTVSISTPDVDKALAALTEDELAEILVEGRADENERRLYVHLPTTTLVYSYETSRQAGAPIWHELRGGIAADQPWPFANMILAYGKWIGGNGAAIGYLDANVETQFAETAGWKFDTLFIYNEARGGIIQNLELIGLSGRAPIGTDPVAFFSSTLDGVTWGQERMISTGKAGQRNKRVAWRPNRRFTRYISLRFRGSDTAMTAWARLEAEIEPLFT